MTSEDPLQTDNSRIESGPDGATPRGTILRMYYYFAPVWMVVEFFFWPGIRAEMIVGPSLVGVLLFYGVEASIGVAYWKKVPGADWAALLENLVYLVFSVRFLIVQPFDIGFGASEPDGGVAAAFDEWATAVPGVAVSLIYVFVLALSLIWRVSAAEQAKSGRP